MRPLNAAYVLEEQARKQAHQSDRNYWWAYIAEILDRLGLTADEVSPEELSERLGELAVLFVGDLDASGESSALEVWVREGGVLIGCRTRGLDALFGNRFLAAIPQERGPFSLSGAFSLRPSPFTRGIACPLNPEQPLLMASPIRKVQAVDSEELGGMDGGAAVTARRYGKGWAFYWAFDPAQTCWVIHQGRPVDRDWDGDGSLRAGDGILIEDNDPEVPYTDQVMFLLQKMVGVLPFPLIHQLPPGADGSVPDALFFYGGDDEGDPTVDQPAFRFMLKSGLPYHINAMPDAGGHFGVSAVDAVSMQEAGCEISMHYDFVRGFDVGKAYTQEDLAAQTRLFVEAFGKTPVCANTHCVRWTGWHEPALWMSQDGLQAVNGKVHRKSPPSNPVNLVGFSFGTAFPFHYWTDHTLANRRLDFLDLPIVAYECGYKDKQTTDFPVLKRAVQVAVHYQMILNVFYHPLYIAQYAACRKAIAWLLGQIKARGLSILHSTPDRVTQWWLARSQSRVEDVRADAASLDFTVSCAYFEGCVVKVPLGDRTVESASVPYAVRETFSDPWVYLVVPPGETQVQVRLKGR